MENYFLVIKMKKIFFGGFKFHAALSKCEVVPQKRKIVMHSLTQIDQNSKFWRFQMVF